MILMIYNRQVCREFMLPNARDTDYTVKLDKDSFRLGRDIRLSLESRRDGWELKETREYRVKSGGIQEEKHRLKDGDIVEIKTPGGDRLQIVAVEQKRRLQVMAKYNLQNMQEISVGKSEGNLIQYRFMELVSSEHMVFRRYADGWYVEDHSRNGVFCQNVRIEGRRKLVPGDYIDVFGLHILYLGELLAVGVLYGELRVREDILRREEPERRNREKQAKFRREETVYFNRAPRNLPSLHKEEVEIEAPPAPKEMKEKPFFLTIGPAFTMAIPMMLGCGFAIFGSRLSGSTSGAFMYTGLITAISSAAIGVFWSLMNMKYSRQKVQEEEMERFNAYSNYLVRIADSLREKYGQNQAVMNQIYPPAGQCLTLDERSGQLWNRNYSHSDFLYQRIGTGDQPFQVKIQIPKEKFTLINDSLRDKPRQIQEEFRTLHGVPAGVSLREKRLWGLVGGAGGRGAVQLMHTLVAQITASHCYTDVKLVFIYREEGGDSRRDWECMRWFPHVWSADKSIRYMAASELEQNDIFFALANELRSRSENAGFPGASGNRADARPHYILFISSPKLLEGEMLRKYIYDPKPEYGITTFLMAERLEQLPNACEDVIQYDTDFQGIYNLLNVDDTRQPFRLDQVAAGQLELFGQRLANIRVNETESTSEIPSSLDFLEMYGAASPEELGIAERWRKNRSYNHMRVPVGKKAGNADCYLDIHEKFHGPHGLVAGTTGSGKSEMLQTYILSLAVNFSPEDVSFFLIDFKGGGMANLFSGLPHLAGQISNLSGNQIQRAMISIKSENTRRQRLFSEYGVNNINLYTRLYKSGEAEVPVPHLFIIIDEFAELRKAEPEFMQELISVAQVGRSLGVHLILATQKPGGIVDDNIRSNARFRLCLRVQDRQDSNDMLDKPDAAFITQAGRCYFQVGNDEIYELFQSAYSGAVYDGGRAKTSSAAALITRTGKAVLAGRKRSLSGESGDAGKVREKTQLEAVVEHIAKLAKQSDFGETMRLWLPVLKTEIFLPELPEYAGYDSQTGTWPEMDQRWKLAVPVGIYDDPKQQAQRTLFVNLTEGGHHAVCGAAVSGKSTFLQTMIYAFLSRYTPDVLQMYLLDFGSHMLMPFERAPHVGGVIYENQDERIARFFRMLEKQMNERKALFQGGNYSQYVQVNGIKLPAILIVIDNFASFREKTKNAFDNMIFRIAREGAGYGIYLTVTAAGFGMSEIPSRTGENIRTVLSLEQGDKFKYMEVLRVTRLPVFPESGVRGRGLASVDGRFLEFQTALSLPAEDDFARTSLLESVCQCMRESWKGNPARTIPEIPENPSLGLLTEEPQYREALAKEALLPAGYLVEDASVYSVNLANTYCYAISGKSRTGKTNMLKILMEAAGRKRGRMCVIEMSANELKIQAEEKGALYIQDAEGLFRFLADLLPEFSARNKKKRALLEQGKEEWEIFGEMQKEEPVFIFLADLKEFFQMVYKPGDNIGNMSGFVENIMEKGSLHHIYFFGCLKVEDESSLLVYKAYSSFVSYKRGIHLGGNLAAQKVFNFENIPYSSQSRTMKRGAGYVPDDEEEGAGVEVIIPAAGRRK